jgi:hypothetical protein
LAPGKLFTNESFRQMAAETYDAIAEVELWELSDDEDDLA